MPTVDYAVHKTIEEGYQETIHQLRYENAQLRAALEEMINPPTIMETDHPFEVASWFVEKAKQVLADSGGMEDKDVS